MLDEPLLDAPDDLARADRRGLLRGAAEAGARVRTAARHATEAGLADLRPDGRPRAVLIAGPGTAATGVADLLGALAGASAPVTRLHPTGVAHAAGALRWALPGWAGPVDLLLIATTDGTEPGLAVLAEQAYRRGCAVVAVAPERSPLSEAVDGAHGVLVPMAKAPYQEYDESAAAGPGALWALLTPLLVLLDKVGLVSAAPDTLQLVADRLDRTAERCGPAIATYSNPAKTLAAELADSLPSSGARAPEPAPPGGASPPPSPSWPAAPRSPPTSPRPCPRTACSSRGRSPPEPTPRTSSGTASRSPRPCAPGSSCCETGPPADSPPPPPPASSPSATTRPSASSNPRRAPSWNSSPNSSP